MILVDSSVWVAYFNGEKNPHTDFLDEILGVRPVGIGDLMLTEVLQGFRSESGYRTARSLLARLPVYEIVGEENALRAFENYRFLRRRGITVRKTIDTLIATFCIEHRQPLLYTDRDFDPFVEHLRLVAALPED